MTRRERLENKLQKRQEWAEKAEVRSERAYSASNAAVAGIPLGQPILVGHHSERRHRRAIERAQNVMSRSCQESNLAKHHESKAAGIERQLERTIFSDDENAIEALNAKIADLESTQEKMRLVNATIRKHAKAGAEAQIAALVALGLNITPERAQALLQPDFCGRIGFASYELTNNNANIRRLEKRIEIIKAQQARHEAAEQAGGVTIEGAEWIRVTFAEKPDRSILNALREAGFRWGGGSWCGERAKLPDCVSELIEPQPEAEKVDPLAESFSRCVPEFRAEIEHLAGCAELTPLAVYTLWREYSTNCSNSDQSALLPEFKQWYAPQLRLTN